MLVSALQGKEVIQLFDDSLKLVDLFLLLDEIVKKAFDPSKTIPKGIRLFPFHLTYQFVEPAA